MRTVIPAAAFLLAVCAAAPCAAQRQTFTEECQTSPRVEGVDLPGRYCVSATITREPDNSLVVDLEWDDHWAVDLGALIEPVTQYDLYFFIHCDPCDWDHTEYSNPVRASIRDTAATTGRLILRHDDPGAGRTEFGLAGVFALGYWGGDGGIIDSLLIEDGPVPPPVPTDPGGGTPLADLTARHVRIPPRGTGETWASESCDTGGWEYCLLVGVTRETDDSLAVYFEWHEGWAAAVESAEGRAVTGYRANIGGANNDRLSAYVPDRGTTRTRVRVPADFPEAHLSSFPDLWVHAYTDGTPVPAVPIAGLALLAAVLAAAGLRRLAGPTRR